MKKITLLFTFLLIFMFYGLNSQKNLNYKKILFSNMIKELVSEEKKQDLDSINSNHYYIKKNYLIKDTIIYTENSEKLTNLQTLINCRLIILSYRIFNDLKKDRNFKYYNKINIESNIIPLDNFTKKEYYYCIFEYDVVIFLQM